MAPQTKPITARFDDQQQERVRQNHEQRITELQAGVGISRILTRKILTDATGTGQLPAGSTSLEVQMVGGGGGGGGGAGGAGVGAAGGGASGVYLNFVIDGIGDGLFTFSNGAAGAGGTSAGGNGGNGGDTTLTVGGKTYTAKGGGGGTGSANLTVGFSSKGGTPGTGSSAAAEESGTSGDRGVLIAGGAFWSGAGGSNPMGIGGESVDGNILGVNGRGAGAGGSGGCATSTGKTGGAGSPGKIVLTAIS